MFWIFNDRNFFTRSRIWNDIFPIEKSPLQYRHRKLHFSVGNFWLEWFPCTKKTIAKRFIDSITGYLSGEYRVYEHYRGDACVKAELQKPMNGAWETIGTSVRFRFNPFPWKKTYIEFKNT